jgi:hypothetical protein
MFVFIDLCRKSILPVRQDIHAKPEHYAQAFKVQSMCSIHQHGCKQSQVDSTSLFLVISILEWDISSSRTKANIHQYYCVSGLCDSPTCNYANIHTYMLYVVHVTHTDQHLASFRCICGSASIMYSIFIYIQYINDMHTYTCYT